MEYNAEAKKILDPWTVVDERITILTEEDDKKESIKISHHQS